MPLAADGRLPILYTDHPMNGILDAIFPISAQTFVGIVVVIAMLHIILVTLAMLAYFERKISAYIQDRIGPNRVGFDFGLPMLKKLFRGFGFWGLGQSVADGIKFLLKEDYMPRGADKWLFTLAPMTAIIPALIGWGDVVHRLVVVVTGALVVVVGADAGDCGECEDEGFVGEG